MGMLAQGSGECAIFGKQVAMASKGEDTMPLRVGDSNSRNPPSGNSYRHAQGDTCTRMFSVALCITAKKWKQSTWPSGGKWMNELWSIYPTNPTEQKNSEETGFIGINTN